MSDAPGKTLDLVKTMLLLNDMNSIDSSFLRKYLSDLFSYFSKISNPYLSFNIQIFLEKKLNLPPIEKNICSHPYLFLLMLEQAPLMLLKKTLGALYCLKSIRKVIDKQKKKELLDYLGEDVYFFVIKQGELYAPFLQKIKFNLKRTFSIVDIENVGQFLLEYLWCRQPDSLIQRFILRFDASITWDFRHVIDCEIQDQLLNLCRRLLRQEEKIGLC